MLLGETRGFERPAKLFPFQTGILSQPGLLIIREAVHGCGKGTDGFLDAFIRGRQLEPRVKELQMRPELLAQCPGELRVINGWPRHRAIDHTVCRLVLTMGRYRR